MQITYTLEEIDQVAKQILANANSRTFLFYGEVGAGKTTLIKSLAQNLGVTDSLSSPSFSLVNEHLTSSGEKIYHFDLYRLQSIEEAYDIGIEDYLDSKAWIFIEWPDKILNLLADSYHKIEISRIEGEKRILRMSSLLSDIH